MDHGSLVRTVRHGAFMIRPFLAYSYRNDCEKNFMNANDGSGDTDDYREMALIIMIPTVILHH